MYLLSLVPLSQQLNISIAVHFQGSKPVRAAGLRVFPCIFSHSFPFLNSLTLALLSTSKEVRATELRVFPCIFSHSFPFLNSLTLALLSTSKEVRATELRAFPCIFSHSFPFLNSLTLALLSTSKEVRAAGLRAFRHMFSDEVGLAKILACRIDIFITRSVLGEFEFIAYSTAQRHENIMNTFQTRLKCLMYVLKCQNAFTDVSELHCYLLFI